MNRALLKQDAREAMNNATPHPILTTLAFFAITLAITLFMNIFTLIQAFSETIGTQNLMGWLICSMAILIFSLLSGCIQFGYYAYSLKVFQQQDTGIGELFSHFHLLLKVFWLALRITLRASLWALLFIIPGIIAMLRYSQVFYILAENPDMSTGDCIRESKELMKGHLWEYIILNLSFFFWNLLNILTLGLASLYVYPYMQITLAGYYLSLKPRDMY